MPKPTINQTLSAFSDEVDEYLGRNAGFGSTVQGLAEARAQLRAVEAARAAYYDRLKAEQQRGCEFVITDDRKVRLALMERPKQTRRSVPADRVKKYDQRLWQKAKAVVPFVQAKAPHWAKPDAVGYARRVVRPADTLVTLVNGYDDARPVLVELRETEADLVARLGDIGDEAGWDGLPLIFTDEWVVSLRREQYSSDRLREIEPDLWNRLCVETVVEPAPQLKVVPMTGDEIAAWEAENGD